MDEKSKNLTNSSDIFVMRLHKVKTDIMESADMNRMQMLTIFG